MATKKGQSDGIRKRASTRGDHTISLVGKNSKEKAKVQVPEPFVPKPQPRPEIKKPQAVVPPPVVPPVVPKKPEPIGDLFPEGAKKKSALSAPAAVEKSKPKTVVELPARASGAPPLELPKELMRPEDKVSSWFFKKKPDEKKDDFYTGIGFSEEDREEGKEKRSPLFKGILVGAGSVLLLIVLVSTVFARLTVSIKPKAETVDVQDVSIVFDTSASEVIAKQKVIPAAKLELSKTVSQDYDASGVKNASFPARGRVKIYNAFNTSSQQLIATTRFLTDKGVLYRLPQAVTVPPAKLEGGKIVPQFIETELVADSSGEGGNISGSATLQLPGFQGTPRYGKFYAVAESGFSGGAVGERRVVTAEDRTRASEEVTKRVYDELEKESVSKVPPDFTVSDSLKSIEITQVDIPSVDTVADRFSARADAVASLMVFRESDVIEFLKGLTVGSDEKREIVPGSVSLTYTVRSVDYAKGRADVIVRGTIETRAVISEEDILSTFVGRKKVEIEESLSSRTDIESSTVSLFPVWLFSAPSDAGKIKIKYE